MATTCEDCGKVLDEDGDREVECPYSGSTGFITFSDSAVPQRCNNDT